MAAKQSFRAGNSVEAFFLLFFFIFIFLESRDVFYYSTIPVLCQVLLTGEMISGMESTSPLFLFMEKFKRSGWIDR